MNIFGFKPGFFSNHLFSPAIPSRVKSSLKTWAMSIMMTLILAACGGGGGGGSSTTTYTIGGSLTGLTSGSVVLQQNGVDDLTLSANGNFSFTTSIDDGSDYD